MRDLHYKGRTFRIDDLIYEDLKRVKEIKEVSWNLLFRELLNEFRKKKR